MTTITQASKALGSAGSPSSVTIPAVTVGKTLLVYVVCLASAAPASPSTALTDNLGNTDYTLDFASSTSLSIKHYFYRNKNFANAPTSLLFQGSVSTTAYFEWIEIDNASVDTFVASLDVLLSASASQATHTLSYTVSTFDSFLFFGAGTGTSRTLNSASNGFTVVPTETTAPPHGFYQANVPNGAASTLLTFSGATIANGVGVMYAPLITSPSVTSITGGSVAEGSAITLPVVLASATTQAESYAATLVGSGTFPATGGGTDFTSDLASAAYTNGVTFSAGRVYVPTSVSGYSVTIQTIQDALYENGETFTLTIGGTSGIVTIVNDDPLPEWTVSGATESADHLDFTVTLAVPSGVNAVFNWATSNGTSASGVDYTAASGSLTFLPGEVTKAVVVNRLP